MMQTFIKIGATSYDAADYTLPAERTFRGAWKANEGAEVIFVDMVAAREIWRDSIRQARKPVFEALDAEFIRKLETGGDTAEIVAQKQALRDAPADPTIDAATTPEELILIKPAGLEIKTNGL